MKKQKYPMNAFENYPINNALSFMIHQKNMALIIPCKTRIFWGHQIGGIANLHKSMEGVLIPFREKRMNFAGGEKRRLLMVDHLYNYFVDRKDLAGNILDNEAIEYIKNLFNSYNLPFEVDIDKKDDSYEAWLWIKIKAQENWEEVSNWVGESVVLIWDNTD
jgi:hypothetical protein